MFEELKQGALIGLIGLTGDALDAGTAEDVGQTRGSGQALRLEGVPHGGVAGIQLDHLSRFRILAHEPPDLRQARLDGVMDTHGNHVVAPRGQTQRALESVVAEIRQHKHRRAPLQRVAEDLEGLAQRGAG